MQKAQSSSSESWEKIVDKRQAEVAGWVRDLGLLEAWKKVADSKVHLIFASLPIRGPVLSDEMEKDAVDAIYRLTWWEVRAKMTEVEEAEAWRENRDAMEEYAAALAEKTVADRWERVLAGSG